MNHLKTGNAYFGKGSYKNFKYNGQELQETGMYDYGARLYMADVGRFGALDPLIEETDQPYAYANNNPVNFIDYLGMKAIANPPDDSSAYPLDYKYTDSEGSWIKVVGGWKSLDAGGTSFVDNIVLPVPSSSKAPVMPINCSACFYYGGGMDITLPKPQGGLSNQGGLAGLSQFRGPEPGGGSLNYDMPIFTVPYMLLEAGVTEVFTRGGMKPETAHSNAQLAVFLFTLKPGSVTGKVGETINTADKTFEIADGVRRAKIAEKLGHTTIKAMDNAGNIFQIPIKNLRSPMKSSIPNDIRYKSLLNQIEKDGQIFPIYVQPGNRGIPVNQITIIP